MSHSSRIALSFLVFSLGTASIAYGAESAGQYIDDATITAKIKAAIATDTVLKQTNISVATNQGIVQLGGTVSSKNEEDEAVRLAQHADGTKSVNDLIRIPASQSP